MQARHKFKLLILKTKTPSFFRQIEGCPGIHDYDLRFICWCIMLAVIGDDQSKVKSNYCIPVFKLMDIR